MKQHQHFFLCIYGWKIWLPILLGGIVLMGVLGTLAAVLPVGVVWAAEGVVGVLTFAGLAFFRDFHRTVPHEAGVMVAPADGRVTEITRVENYPLLGGAKGGAGGERGEGEEGGEGGAVWRVGIFLSVLDVHVNRAPCDGVVLSTKFEPGLFLDARHPESGLKNQSFTIVLGEAEKNSAAPIAVVRQVVGAIARRIISPVTVGDVWQRGARFGMIAFGSRTELYVPVGRWDVTVKVGEHVKGGTDVVCRRAR